ncbi:apolipoprotein C-II-like [Scyliorhinus canicula]|uniref:apolipoprotein C-II-like n=1 Tax=Scyliorhinus canicula TaxID=7830 RepID=UPI0018F448B7|nr:apolipoprotein C-II-like [Scyliorhinus canicula]
MRNMMMLNVVTLPVVLFTLSCCVSTGDGVLKDQSAEVGFTDTLQEYWNSVSTKITNWYETAASSSTAQFLKGVMNNSTAAINTYTRILFDQLMHSV